MSTCACNYPDAWNADCPVHPGDPLVGPGEAAYRLARAELAGRRHEHDTTSAEESDQ